MSKVNTTVIFVISICISCVCFIPQVYAESAASSYTDNQEDITELTTDELVSYINELYDRAESLEDFNKVKDLQGELERRLDYTQEKHLTQYKDDVLTDEFLATPDVPRDNRPSILKSNTKGRNPGGKYIHIVPPKEAPIHYYDCTKYILIGSIILGTISLIIMGIYKLLIMFFLKNN